LLWEWKRRKVGPRIDPQNNSKETKNDTKGGKYPKNALKE
jgi:hypothetical protein